MNEKLKLTIMFVTASLFTIYSEDLGYLFESFIKINLVIIFINIIAVILHFILIIKSIKNFFNNESTSTALLSIVIIPLSFALLCYSLVLILLAMG